MPMKALAPRASAKKIIYAYLNRKLSLGENYISSHNLETELVKYGEMYWGLTKLPSAYSRAWREIRQKEEYKNHNIESVVEQTTESAEATWKITRRTI